jgi:hypothetical protein
LVEQSAGPGSRQLKVRDSMKSIDVPQKGKRGKVVASRNHFGPYQKEFVSPNQPGTASQRGVWGNMTEFSWVWNDISDERRLAWRRRAAEVRSRSNMGKSGVLHGSLLLKKINLVLRTCGREPLLDPPPLPVFGPNPVVGFVIRQGRGGIALKVKVSPDVRWEDRPALEDLMVFAWVPCNAGVDKNGLYVFLGLLPAPVRGESDITKLYLKKLKEWRKLKDKRYHIPLEGARIFIRVWQQVNGFENEVGMFLANALVPARTWPGWAEKKRQQ